MDVDYSDCNCLLSTVLCACCYQTAAADDALSYARCTQFQFRCVSTGRCISDRSHCDGYCDCSDCSDERNCGESTQFLPLTCFVTASSTEDRAVLLIIIARRLRCLTSCNISMSL